MTPDHFTLTDLLAAVPALLPLSPSGRILVHRQTSVRSHIGLSISRTHTQTFIKLHENSRIQQTEIQGSHDLRNALFIEICLWRDSNYNSVAVAHAVVELDTFCPIPSHSLDSQTCRVQTQTDNSVLFYHRRSPVRHAPLPDESDAKQLLTKQLTWLRIVHSGD